MERFIKNSSVKNLMSSQSSFHAMPKKQSIRVYLPCKARESYFFCATWTFSCHFCHLMQANKAYFPALLHLCYIYRIQSPKQASVWITRCVRMSSRAPTKLKKSTLMSNPLMAEIYSRGCSPKMSKARGSGPPSFFKTESPR